MHPFSADANALAQSSKHRSSTRKDSHGHGQGQGHGAAANVLSASTSTRLPSYIDFSSGQAKASGGPLNGNARDDKYRRRNGRFALLYGWRKRFISRANNATGWVGALQRTLIRAGILERQFWRRALLGLLLLALAGLALFRHVYETQIELAFYSRSWVDRVIKPVPDLSGTCFAGTAADAYNYSSSTTGRSVASTTPINYLQLNPGISMKFGLDCYHFSRQLPSVPIPGQVLPEYVIYHLYWRADLAPLGPRQVLLIQSILATQEPIARTSVILWTNDAAALSAHALLAPVLEKARERFSVRQADFDALAHGTTMQDHALLAHGGRDARAWIDGDLIRILVLYAYGGVWVDMDSLMLRSIYPLLEQEWITQWDCYDKPYAPLNGAMMHFRARSPYLCEMLHIMAHGPTPRPKSTDWGSVLYHQLHRRLLQAGIRPFAILPYCFTDPRSCRYDNRLPDPFLKRDDKYITSEIGRKQLEYMVESVFSIHLHNQWDKIWPRGGWMDRLVVKPLEEKWSALGP